MGNKQGTLANHLETATKTGALAFPDKKLEEFPEALTKVSGTLRNLDLSNNRIATLPNWIGNFKSLKTLNLSNNRLTRLPDEIGQLVKLETLILNRNQLVSLPSSIANLKNLREIDCSKNQLASFPIGLANLKQLNIADLSSNKISVVPNGVDGLQLTELNLNQNQISTLSASLAECPRLKTLRLEENCLSLDALPKDLLTKSTVSTLCLAGNMFSEKQLSDLDGYEVYLSRYTAVRRKLD